MTGVARRPDGSIALILWGDEADEHTAVANATQMFSDTQGFTYEATDAHTISDQYGSHVLPVVPELHADKDSILPDGVDVALLSMSSQGGMLADPQMVRINGVEHFFPLEEDGSLLIEVGSLTPGEVTVDVRGITKTIQVEA